MSDQSWLFKGRVCSECTYPVVVTQGKERDYRYYCSNPDCPRHSEKNDLYDVDDPPDWVQPEKEEV